jgi:hypothetical protein
MRNHADAILAAQASVELTIKTDPEFSNLLSSAMIAGIKRKRAIISRSCRPPPRSVRSEDLAADEPPFEIAVATTDMGAFHEAPCTPGDDVPMSGAQSTAAIGVERNVPAVELVEHDPEQLGRFCADH